MSSSGQDGGSEGADELLVEVRERVAWITVNRPAVRNAVSRAMCGRIADSLRSLGADPDVRAVVLRGAGERVFISGADVNEFRTALASPAAALDYDAAAERVQSAIKAIPQPVIAMIHGYAIGSGCIIAVACDFRMVASTARFGIPVAKFGFVAPLPDVHRLVALVGPAKAKWMLMSGAVFDAAKALSIGLVDEVLPPEDLVARTESFALQLAANAPLSIKAAKEMIEQAAEAVADVYRAAPWYREIFRSADLKEGLEAFFAKRKPDFHGH
jgi:enoyl-CoA hydratase/carnithine racemase